MGGEWYHWYITSITRELLLQHATLHWVFCVLVSTHEYIYELIR